VCAQASGSDIIEMEMQIVHEKVYDEMVERLLKAYSQVKAGNPLEEGTLLGPLHSPLSKAIKSQVNTLSI
jgi:aldehyde dehydrogenase family 7 protein A1